MFSSGRLAGKIKPNEAVGLIYALQAIAVACGMYGPWFALAYCILAWLYVHVC